MFTRDTAGDLASGWTQVAKLTAGDGAAGDDFGAGVSIERQHGGGRGARWDDTDKGAGSGSAYVFSIYLILLATHHHPQPTATVGELHRLFSERLVVHTDVRHRLLADG